MKPRHFSFVGHCRGQGEDTTLGQTLIYFSIFFTKFRRNSGKPLLSCPQVNSVNCSNECYVQGPQHVILPYFNHFSDVHGLCQFRRDSVYLFLFMTRHQQERSSGQVLSLLTFIIKNESPRHVALRHRIRIGELQLSWQNRPAGYSRLSIPADACLICNVDSVIYQPYPFFILVSLWFFAFSVSTTTNWRVDARYHL